MEGRTRTAKSNRQTRLRLIGLTLGIAGIVASFPASFLSCVGNIQSNWSPQLVYVAFSWLIYCGILLVACKWALVGGVLLILDSSLLAAFLGDEFLVVLSHLPLPPFLDTLFWGLWLFISLSLLASGILFILSWAEERRCA